MSLPFPGVSSISQAPTLGAPGLPKSSVGGHGHIRGHLNPETAPESPFLKGERCHFILGTIFSIPPNACILAGTGRLVWNQRQSGTEGPRTHELGSGHRTEGPGTHELGSGHRTGSFGLNQHSDFF